MLSHWCCYPVRRGKTRAGSAKRDAASTEWVLLLLLLLCRRLPQSLWPLCGERNHDKGAAIRVRCSRHGRRHIVGGRGMRMLPEQLEEEEGVYFLLARAGVIVLWLLQHCHLLDKQRHILAYTCHLIAVLRQHYLLNIYFKNIYFKCLPNPTHTVRKTM